MTVYKTIEKEVRIEEEEKRYELFTEVEATGTDGKPVTILKSLGVKTVAELNRRKADLQKNIDEINLQLAGMNKTK